MIGPEVLLPFAAAGTVAALLRGDALVAHLRGLCVRTRPTGTAASVAGAMPPTPTSSTPGGSLCQRCHDGAAVDALVLSVEVDDEVVVEVIELCAVCQAALTRSGRAA